MHDRFAAAPHSPPDLRADDAARPQQPEKQQQQMHASDGPDDGAAGACRRRRSRLHARRWAAPCVTSADPSSMPTRQVLLLIGVLAVVVLKLEHVGSSTDKEFRMAEYQVSE